MSSSRGHGCLFCSLLHPCSLGQCPVQSRHSTDFGFWAGAGRELSYMTMKLWKCEPTSWSCLMAKLMGTQRTMKNPEAISYSALPALDCENQLLPKLAWVRFWSLNWKSPTITLHSPVSALSPSFIEREALNLPQVRGTSSSTPSLQIIQIPASPLYVISRLSISLLKPSAQGA